MTRFVLFLLVWLCGVCCSAAPARRIVSLAPAVTEMLFAVGAGKNVVGDTTFCDYPSQARALPHIGDVRTNYEAVLALHPDLVVASDANRAAAARLSVLGVRVLTVASTSFAATKDSIRTIGQATGHAAQAAMVVRQMERKSAQAAQVAARDGNRPRVLCVVGTGPLWTAGAGTFVDDVLRRAGAVNLSASINGYGPLSPESVLNHPPDYVLAMPADAAALRRQPAFSALMQSLPPGHVVAFDPDMLLRPGPRLADALLSLAHSLHGTHR